MRLEHSALFRTHFAVIVTCDTLRGEVYLLAASLEEAISEPRNVKELRVALLEK